MNAYTDYARVMRRIDRRRRVRAMLYLVAMTALFIFAAVGYSK